MASKRVVVAGGNGFLGSYTVQHPREEDIAKLTLTFFTLQDHESASRQYEEAGRLHL